jgi:hypothetical protein
VEEGGDHHRDSYLEQQQTENIENEVRDVDRIQIRKVYLAVQCGLSAFGGHKSTLVRHKYMLIPPACISLLITEDLPSRAAAGVYFQ